MSKAKKGRARSRGAGEGNQPKGQPTPKRNVVRAAQQSVIERDARERHMNELLNQLAVRLSAEASFDLSQFQPLLQQFNTLTQAGEYRAALELLKRPLEGGNGEGDPLLSRLGGFDSGEEQRVLAELLTPAAAAQLEDEEIADLINRMRFSWAISNEQRWLAKVTSVCTRLLPALEQRGSGQALNAALDAIVFAGMRKRQPRAVLEYQQRLVQLAEQAGDRTELIGALQGLSDIYSRMNQPVSAAAQRARVDQMFAAAPVNEKLKIADDVVGTSNIWSNDAWAESYRQQFTELAPQADLPTLDSNLLAWIAGDYIEDERFAEALPFAERLIEVMKQEGAGDDDLIEPLSDLAYVYEKLGRDEERVPILKQLNAIAPTETRDMSEWVVESLVDALEKLGRGDEATPYREQLAALGE